MPDSQTFCGFREFIVDFFFADITSYAFVSGNPHSPDFILSDCVHSSIKLCKIEFTVRELSDAVPVACKPDVAFPVADNPVDFCGRQILVVRFLENTFVERNDSMLSSKKNRAVLSDIH